jgi:predicted amidohydrolase YtcJ
VTDSETRPARRLITGATLWAGADCAPRQGWLLTDGERIAGIGDADCPVPEADETIEARGRHVLPGFVDAHTHLTLATWLLYGNDGAAWSGLDEALGDVRRTAAFTASDVPWMLFWNVSLHEWPQGRLPTADELDAAAPGRKVLVGGVDLHRGSVSLAALDDLGVPGVRGGGPRDRDVGRDLRGRPTGELWEAAFGSALRRAVADTEAYHGDVGSMESLRAEVWRHLSYGITHAHDPFVPPSAHQRMLDLRGDTPIRLSWATGPEAGLLNPPAGPDREPDGPYGDAGREVKIFLDGADRCGLRLPLRALPGLLGGTVRQGWRVRATGPVREGLRRRLTVEGGTLQTPYLRFTDTELTGLLGRYAEAGFRVRLHALGNLAAEQAARTLATARIPAGQATVDHLTALDRRTADLVAGSGAYAGYQPGFLPRFGSRFTDLGIDRHLSILGARLLTSSGAPLVLSSDHPCGPLDPLCNLRTAVSRELANGRTLQPGEALTPSEAVRAATIGAARSVGAVGSGGLAVGEVADMAICTGDPFDPATRVAETWVGGDRVWPR